MRDKSKKGEEMSKGNKDKPMSDSILPQYVKSKENDGIEIALKGSVDSHHYDSLLLKAKSRSKYPILTKEDYLSAFNRYKVSSDIAKKASAILAKNPPLLVAASGKNGSGQDVIALEVFKRLNTSPDYKRLSYASPVKDEVQEILNMLRNNTKSAATKALRTMGASKEQAIYVVDTTYEVANNEPEATSHDRTPWIRLLLQYWGTEVRKNKEENYWINKAVQKAAEYIVAGNSILVTDARFPGEVKALQEIGFLVFRLNITQEVQISRLTSRDGLLPDKKALNHSTETALDNYDGFNLVIESSDISIDTVVNKIVKFYKSRIKASL